MENLRGKKIAILGMGANNKHLAEYLKKFGIPFDVFENWKSHDELLGKLTGYDMLFRTPGLPYFSKPIQEAVQAGVEVSSQTKLFFELCPAKIVGVTGTKGKGTTSSLITAILTAAGHKVWLGGNIGKDPFEFLSQVLATDIVVMELSSFQLQDLNHSPHVAVVLNITPDHLNHHSNFEEYIDAKTSILKYQKETDFAIIHPSLPDLFQGLGLAQKTAIDPQAVVAWERKLLGEHNLDNIAAAAQAARILAVPDDVIKSAIASFEALPHRLKVIREYQGITIIDDGFSTNIDPAIAAIEAIRQPIVLIVGGHDKGLDFASLGEKIKTAGNVKAVVVVGQVTEKIQTAMSGYTGQVMTGAKDMQEIISQATSLAAPGDAILFSPATSSFDMFKNEYDRAEQFVSGVEALV